MAFAIRASRPADLGRLREIYQIASLSNEGDREGLLENPQNLDLPPEAAVEGRTRVAENASGELVGFATLEIAGTKAELVDLFVDPAQRRTGVARALLADALVTLGSLGIDTLEVTANPHALAFYEAEGFELIGSEATPLGLGMRMRLSVSS